MKTNVMPVGANVSQPTPYFFRTTICLTFASLSSFFTPAGLAQTFTDEIKVGTQLTPAGITMRGFSAPVFPLPPGNWEVLARSDEGYALSNRLGEVLAPAPKVVLTLFNKSMSANAAIVLATYSPEVVRIRWRNSPCEIAKEDFVDSAGTTTGSLDYACAKGTYSQRGLKNYIAKSLASDSDWRKKYIAPLAPFVETLPDANIWINFTTNRDRGRTFDMTVIGRSSLTGKVDDAFDKSIRAWVNLTEKALIAALNGDKSTISEFPSPILP